jgi:hypothetical protein
LWAIKISSTASFGEKVEKEVDLAPKRDGMTSLTNTILISLVNSRKKKKNKRLI